MQRNYAEILAGVRAEGTTRERIVQVVDALWQGLSRTGVSWAGIYVPDPDDAEALVLEYCRDKPACSPIGLHGACGRSFREGRSLVVRDVRALGENYVACDPRDQSEVVVPLRRADGACDGVLDLDSFDVGAFGPEDAAWLERVLVRAGLSRPTDAPAMVV